jgi:hypothetical protein
MHRRQATDRSFGFSVGGVFGALAAVAWWRGHETAAAAFAALAVPLVALAAIHPPLLAAPKRLWLRVAHAIGGVNTRALLSVMFYLVVTPIGLVRRLAGGDPLRRRWPPTQTGWVAARPRLRDPKHYERMY